MTRCKVVVTNNKRISLPLDSEESAVNNDTLDVNTEAFELMMNSYMGGTLSDVHLGDGEKHSEVCRKYVRHYSNYYKDDDFFSKVSSEYFVDNPIPSAMFYKGTAELMRDVLIMYQLSYFHYLLGKKNEMKDSFPKYCCGISCHNLVVSLWEAGIISATMIYCRSYDHAYLIIPFILNNPVAKGVILLDPTSDQLMFRPNEKVRNDIKVFCEKNWRYETDWEDGNNLYPDVVEISSCYGREDVDYGKYLKTALKNPVTVT